MDDEVIKEVGVYIQALFRFIVKFSFHNVQHFMVTLRLALHFLQEFCQ